MKPSDLSFLTAACLISLAGPSLLAAPIVWEVNPLSEDSDISNEGVLIEAAYFNGPAGGNALGGASQLTDPITVNSVEFSNVDFAGGGSLTALTGLTYNNGEFGHNTETTGALALAAGLAFQSGVDPQNGTLINLTSNTVYQVQFIYYHRTVNRSVTILDGEGGDALLADTGQPVIATGTFTADSDTQALTFDANTGSQFLNAYQLRQFGEILDGDGDGMPDEFEIANGLNPDDDSDATSDADMDGSNNLEEFERGTDVNDDDSDDDGLLDGNENDSGVNNGPTDPGTDPLDPDSDADGISDGDEVSPDNGFVTDPLLFDTDGDGFNDGSELDAGTNPTVPDSPPLDDLLCAYWPLDETDGLTTPDLGPNGYDLELVSMDASNFVEDEGRLAATFNGIDTMLIRLHEEGDDLPITQHGAYTIAMWVKVAGTGQNDLRFFAEASTTSPDPLLNLGTRNNGSDDSVDVYLRDSGSPNHQFSNGLPLDGTWRHIVYTHSDADQKIQLYVDGVLDKDDWIFKDIVNPLNSTSVGGIRRATPSHWVTGSVDEVSLWKTVLSPDNIAKLASGTTALDLIDPTRLRLDITNSGEDLVLEWESQSGKRYNLRSATDPSSDDPKDWPIYEDNMDMVPTPDTNTLTIPRPDDATRYFVIEEFPAPPVTIFTSDFEAGQGDWTTGSDGVAGTAWELGAPSNVGPTASNSPDNCFGTNIAADYELDADIWLRSPEIDLTAAGAATLTFAQFTDIEAGFDLGTVAVLDAADDSELAIVEAAIDGITPDWETVTRKIPAEGLGKIIKLEFRFTSDDIGNFAGWYIDDVAISTPAP